VALVSGTAQASPIESVEVNVGGTINVVKAVRRAVGLVHVRSLGIHDVSRPRDAPLDEDLPAGDNPRVYLATKVSPSRCSDASLPPSASSSPG
jgi:nucleoside-diphosphate-sugar epimerase